MQGYSVILLFAAFEIIEGGNSVTGTILGDTSWFHSNLSVRPAMTASIEYNIQFPVPGTSIPILKFYDNGQNSSDLHKKCIGKRFGQLLNENLIIPLKACYSTGCSITHCEVFGCTTKCTTWSCHGNTKIQDIERKLYSFSIGYGCKECDPGCDGCLRLDFLLNIFLVKFELTVYFKHKMITE